MEELKDIWKNQRESTIKFSDKDILEMVQKKSSSIVRWILIISILEFVLPNLLYFFTNHDATLKLYADYGMNNLAKIYTIIHVFIILGFIYLFFKNYKNISTENNVKLLIHNILKTRKTVKYYIYYNLTMAGIIGIHIFYIVFNSQNFTSQLSTGASMLILWLVALVLLALALFIFWIFYRLLYGILLKKLNKNYTELMHNY